MDPDIDEELAWLRDALKGEVKENIALRRELLELKEAYKIVCEELKERELRETK